MNIYNVYKSGIICFLIAIFSSGFQVDAQTFKYIYSYDESGNRIKRLSEIEMAQMNEQNDNPTSEEKASIDNYNFLETIGPVEVFIYPNPTEGLLYLEMGNMMPETEGTITVSSIEGRVIFQEKLSELIIIDLNKHNNAIYMLQVQIGIETKIYKIVKR